MEFFRDWPSLAGKRLLPTLFLATALMLGCSSSDDKAFTGNGGSDTGGSPADTTAPLVTADPELSMAPKTDVPLAGILTITTDEATRVSLDINDGTTTRSHTFTGYDTSLAARMPSR